MDTWRQSFAQDHIIAGFVTELLPKSSIHSLLPEENGGGGSAGREEGIKRRKKRVNRR